MKDCMEEPLVVDFREQDFWDRAVLAVASGATASTLTVAKFSEIAAGIADCLLIERRKRKPA